MKNALLILGPIFSVVILSACSIIVDGSSQDITLNTNPPQASCVLTRNGENLGAVTSTPGSIHIEKTKYDILITCQKEGYQTATYINHSGADGMTFGNMALGGVIGWGIDSASGSDNKYDGTVNLTLPRI